MGATPLHYLLTVSVPPTTDAAWFVAFAHGLAQDQAHFGLTLLGGDTTSTPGPISLSATIIGHVAPGQALRRAGAQPGDELWVTGTIGDAALGLRARTGEIAESDDTLTNRYLLPQPRLGLALHGIVHAAMDVSDGLIQDCGHLARAAGLGATIDTATIPLSPAARAANRLALCLSGGDDYELLLAVPPNAAAALQAECRRADIPVTRIGHFHQGTEGVQAIDAAGNAFPIAQAGFSHF